MFSGKQKDGVERTSKWDRHSRQKNSICKNGVYEDCMTRGWGEDKHGKGMNDF